MSVAMIAVFLAALVIPEAYEDLPGGWHGPLVLALAYTFVRLVHMTLYIVAAGDDAALRRQVLDDPGGRDGARLDRAHRRRAGRRAMADLDLARRIRLRRGAHLGEFARRRRMAHPLDRALDRAVRPRRDPRPGRVDRRDRGRRRARADRRADRPRHRARRHPVDPALVGVLRSAGRSRRARARRAVGCRARRARPPRLHVRAPRDRGRRHPGRPRRRGGDGAHRRRGAVRVVRCVRARRGTRAVHGGDGGVRPDSSTWGGRRRASSGRSCSRHPCHCWRRSRRCGRWSSWSACSA